MKCVTAKLEMEIGLQLSHRETMMVRELGKAARQIAEFLVKNIHTDFKVDDWTQLLLDFGGNTRQMLDTMKRTRATWTGEDRMTP